LAQPTRRDRQVPHRPGTRTAESHPVPASERNTLMTWNKNHPARSHAFLSRLHDGDLEPSERAHFEAHRAHCAECRTAAAEFERALSLFRSARSSPPPADMANRVLRKLRSVEARSRSPFGRALAVDWRWASAFAVALLVLLIGAPIALRQPERIAVPAPQ